MKSARRPAAIARAIGGGGRYECRALVLLRATLKRYNLSERHLARTLRISPTTAANLLDGTAEPRVSHIFTCRRVFRIPLDAWKTREVKAAEKAA